MSGIKFQKFVVRKALATTSLIIRPSASGVINKPVSLGFDFESEEAFMKVASKSNRSDKHKFLLSSRGRNDVQQGASP